MNLNLKMTVERSKRRSQFLSLVFITKCFNKNLLLRRNRLANFIFCNISHTHQGKAKMNSL